MYLIVKLLLNSIYGRFGMSPFLENHIIINEKESTTFCINYDVTNVVSLRNGKELISYLKNNKELDTIGKDNSKNISIALASAVTSYARVYMSEFKTKNNLYYSDTDSIVVDKPLPEEYVGDELGQFKKVCDIKEGVFLLPKVYGFLDDKNKEHVIFKGVKDSIKIKGKEDSVKLKDLKNLLNYDGSLKITQDQWKRDVGLGEIIVINDKPYELNMNSSTKENKGKNIIEKRERIYKNNIYVDTKPIKINFDD
jgi:DNA polymerase family B